MNFSVEVFVARSAEQKFDAEMLQSSISAIKPKVLEYVRMVLDMPCADLIGHAKSHGEIQNFTKIAVPQFSNLSDSTINLCACLQNAQKPLSTIEIGRALQNDGISRTSVANQKYGQEHRRTGQLLGLATKIGNSYGCSALGTVWLAELDPEEQFAFLVRSILRLPLFQSLIRRIGESKISLRDYCPNDSTYRRRCPNFKSLFAVLDSCPDMNFSWLGAAVKELVEGDEYPSLTPTWLKAARSNLKYTP